MEENIKSSYITYVLFTPKNIKIMLFILKLNSFIYAEIRNKF